MTNKPNAKTADPDPPGCTHDRKRRDFVAEPETLERAAALFRALGDTPRLRMLCRLKRGECCLTELVDGLKEKFATFSQRLRVLRSEGLVKRRREQSHVYYALADQHVADLIQNALEHADE